MRIFLAGASGAIGRRLVPLLVQAGHDVTGMTRSAANAKEIERTGAKAAVLDVYDAPAVSAAVMTARPETLIHQLTDLPREFDEAKVVAAYANNARIRIEGTRNLVAAAQAAGVRRLIVQSVAFAYPPGGEPHLETDPLNVSDPVRGTTIKAAADMEEQALASGIDTVLLRYGLFYGPGTWSEGPARKPALHIDAAAQATLLAVTRAKPGAYNIADEDGVVSIAKAVAELGFDPHFRIV